VATVPDRFLLELLREQAEGQRQLEEKFAHTLAVADAAGIAIPQLAEASGLTPSRIHARLQHQRALPREPQPHGVIEQGESAVDAARRELVEEAAITKADFGPCVWTRENRFIDDGTTYVADERIFVAWAENGVEGRPAGNHAEGEIVAELRWWTADELEASPAERSLEQLADLLRDLVSQGVPSHPLRI
jgi:ADP-ribose pyrophosphatase YjhB (NUDIX family)